jgi:hypothetical protein
MLQHNSERRILNRITAYLCTVKWYDGFILKQHHDVASLPLGSKIDLAFGF